MNRRCPILPILLLASTLLGACETVIDVAAPPHDARLVAQGFFTADSLWAVQVSQTVPFVAAEAPAFVDDAAVEVWEDGRPYAALVRADTGLYLAPGPPPAPGKTYTLRVTAPGFPLVEGRDALPDPPHIDAFRETSVLRGEDSGPRRRLTQVTLTLDDPPGADNYYGLLVVQTRWREDRRTGQVTELPPSLFTFESDDLALGENGIDFLDSGKTLYRDAFFTDGLFDGSRYTLRFDVQYDVPAPDAEVVIRRVLTVVLLTASEDLFRYWTTAGRQAFSNENPFAEPLRVHSNMSNGLGIFAGFRYRTFLLPADDPALRRSERPCSLFSGSLPLCVPSTVSR